MTHVGTDPSKHAAAAPEWYAELAGQFDVIVRMVEVGGRSFEIAQPRSADELIDEAEFAVDERLPYWAEVWNSSIALARRIAKEQGSERRFLELGCGVGLPSATAASVGFQATATDYYEPALRFAELNARRSGAPLTGVRILDWRALPVDMPTFDVVAASDVLYERPMADLVAAVFARTLRPGGLGLMADPQRQNGAAFPDACQRHSLKIIERGIITVSDGQKSQNIDLYELTH